jgi:hypothetical protein
MPDTTLDAPIWGATKIGEAAGILKDDGSVDLRRTFYLLETGALDASKVGHPKRGRWVSTPRRVRRSLGIEVAARGEAV